MTNIDLIQFTNCQVLNEPMSYMNGKAICLYLSAKLYSMYFEILQ